MSSAHTLIVSDEAYLDILDAFTWYESIKNGLGGEFEKSIEHSFSTIVRNPDSVQKRYRNVRVAFIKHFPFGIHYTAEKSTLKVIAVFHTARDPKSWADRL